MSINVALVRVKDESGCSKFIGLYFYNTMKDLIFAIDEEIDPSICEYLPAKIKTAAGLLFGGEFSKNEEDNYLKSFDVNSLNSENETDDEGPLDRMEFENLSQEMMSLLSTSFHKQQWRPVVQ